ncbi:MAG TPA: M20 family metallopeptidase [Terriglobales bacterium]|jgi:glutamate carboxypeptidase|nr:M20 family metallopeptidase [Terriglobales bacterium]
MTAIASDGAGVGAARKVVRYLEQRRREMLGTLQALVELESPSLDKTAVDRLGEFLAQEFTRLGGKVKVHRQANSGNHLEASFPAERRGRGGKPVLLLGHMDTVYEVGTLKSMPFRVAQGRAWGPGTFDMKSGIAQMLFALRALRQVLGGLGRPVTVLLVSDEEIGSPTSRRITEALARKAQAVLVLEPAHGPGGALKTSRKGVGDYVVKVTGRAAHAGLDFRAGQSAILELAQQIAVIQKFTDLERGLTVNVGLVRGGTRTNVVAAEAVAEVDVRIARLGDAALVEEKFRSLRSFNPKCKLEVSGGINRPPLERSQGGALLYGVAKGLARGLGWKLDEAAVGGGSDGNFTAALGVPTLDGLGGVGDGAHAPHESVLLAELPRRAALLAGLVETV